MKSIAFAIDEVNRIRYSGDGECSEYFEHFSNTITASLLRPGPSQPGKDGTLKRGNKTWGDVGEPGKNTMPE